MAVAENLHLPAFALAAFAILAVGLAGIVAEEHGIPRRIARWHPQELADVQRLLARPGKHVIAVGKRPSVVEQVADGLGRFEPPGPVRPTSELGVFVRIVDTDDVGIAFAPRRR
jgi:hypothetical protein